MRAAPIHVLVAGVAVLACVLAIDLAPARAAGSDERFPVISWHNPKQKILFPRNRAVGNLWSRVGAAAMLGHGTDTGWAKIATNSFGGFTVSDERMAAVLSKLRANQGRGILFGNCYAGSCEISGTSMLRRYAASLGPGTRVFGATGPLAPLSSGQFMVGPSPTGSRGMMIYGFVNSQGKYGELPLSMEQFNRIAKAEMWAPFEEGRLGNSLAAPEQNLNLRRFGRAGFGRILSPAVLAGPLLMGASFALHARREGVATAALEAAKGIATWELGMLASRGAGALAEAAGWARTAAAISKARTLVTRVAVPLLVLDVCLMAADWISGTNTIENISILVYGYLHPEMFAALPGSSDVNAYYD